MSLERRLDILPAYDKRHKEPGKNYGIHGVDMRWYVIGPEGAVQFVLYTNWQLPHVQKDFDSRVDRQFPHLACHPLPADIGYHSRVPRYEGQHSRKCHLLKGPCYYDGSVLQADEFYNILVTEGGEALWLALEKRYQEWLVEAEGKS